MTSRDIVGIGVLLKTPTGKYLFQERDKNLDRNPECITPFGGGVNKGESVVQCAIRELAEELELELSPANLKEVGVFESRYAPGTYIQLFLAENIDPSCLILHEGQSILELSLKEALLHDMVTGFTKKVLHSLQ